VALVLKRGSWYLRKQMDGVRKDHPLKVSGGEAARPAAEKAAKALEKQLSQAHAGATVLKKLGLQPAVETPKTDDGITLTDWWKKYQEVYSPRKSKRTQRIDKNIMAHWTPLLGSLVLADIRQIDCLRALNLRREAKQANPGHKNPTVIKESTVQRERRLLHAIFERAVENDVITKNPWKGIEKVADVPRSDRILSEDDEVKFVAALRSPAGNDGNVGRAKPERYVRFTTFMLETGLRLDELLNDDFSDRGTHVHVRGKFAKERDVPLTKKARKALDDQITEDGKLWDQTPARFREVLAATCQRAGIPHISPHDLRHTFGHRFLVKGGDIYVLSKLLGHASVAVTEKHYAYLRREDITSKMLAVMEA
jgi:integrase